MFRSKQSHVYSVQWRLTNPLACLFVIATLLSACGDGCGQTIVDYTFPPADQVFAGSDGLVRARVLGFEEDHGASVEVRVEILEVLVDPALDEPIDVGDLRVWAYDHPCGPRTGLGFTNREPVLIALSYEAWSRHDTPWRAYPVLSVSEDGTVAFLDTGYDLNGRIDEILGEPTVEAVTEAVQAGKGE